jgi:hypothetical protein
MKTFVSFVAALSALGQTMAQTPANFTPGSTTRLPAQIGGVAMESGNYVRLEGKACSSHHRVRFMKPQPNWPSIPDIVTSGLRFPLPINITSNTTAVNSALLMMLDLDAPSSANRSLSPLVHYLASAPLTRSRVANLTTVTFDPTSNSSIVPYGRPNPPPGVGRHRYTILLLGSPQQNFTWPTGAREIRANSSADRLGYDVEGFVRAGGFEVLAGNYFATENTTAVGGGAGGGAGGGSGTTPSAASNVMVASSAVWGVVSLVAMAVAYL